jgi:biotin carboxylase
LKKNEKKLAIICASETQKPLIIKAKEMDVETHCFAWDKEKDSVCRKIADYYHPISIIEKEKILEVCREIKIDGIISMVSDPAVPTICYVAENMGLIGNRYEDALVTSNKYHQRQAFLNSGVGSPRFVIARECDDLTGFKYPLIVKPTDRCASIGVMKVEKEEDLDGAIKRAKELSFSKQALIEEYVTGVEVSVETISWEGTHYNLTLTDKETTGAPYFVEIAHHEPSELSTIIQEKIKAEARKALTALNVRYGASDTEIKIAETGEVYVIEGNARLGGDFSHDMVRLSTGYDFLKGVIDVALNQFEKPVISEHKYSGIYFLSKETEHVKQIIENAANDSDIVQSEIYDNELRNIQSSADRSGYFIYQSDRERRWGNF